MIYHIIDHNGFGTMHRLLLPLNTENSNHEVINYDDYLKLEEILTKISENDIVIIHTTASKKSNFIYNFLKYFRNNNIYIFMHVSANYEIFKNRKEVLLYLKKLTDDFNVIVLTPAKEVTIQYKNLGIKAQTIQLGVDSTKIDTSIRKELLPYYNKIITTCSSDNEEYKYVKGIDVYKYFISKNNLEKYSLVAGIDKSDSVDLLCKKFNERDFLNVLSHSIMYVQFSRFESYNLTAVYSKILKKPVLLLNSEGNYSCMNGCVFNDINELEKEALIIMNGNLNIKLIENLYEDAISRETIFNFKKELELLEKKAKTTLSLHKL